MGKITVKHFLNTTLQPEKVAQYLFGKNLNKTLSKREEVDVYPVYVRVTANRQTTNFKSKILESYPKLYSPNQSQNIDSVKSLALELYTSPDTIAAYYSEDIFNFYTSKPDSALNSVLRKEKRALEDIYKELVLHRNENFEVKSLKKAYEALAIPVKTVINNFCMRYLLSAIYSSKEYSRVGYFVDQTPVLEYGKVTEILDLMSKGYPKFRKFCEDATTVPNHIWHLFYEYNNVDLLFYEWYAGQHNQNFLNFLHKNTDNTSIINFFESILHEDLDTYLRSLEYKEYKWFI